jgi:hypothetical protein
MIRSRSECYYTSRVRLLTILRASRNHTLGGERLLSLMASCEFRPLSETPLQPAFKKMKESGDYSVCEDELLRGFRVDAMWRLVLSRTTRVGLNLLRTAQGLLFSTLSINDRVASSMIWS